MASSDLSLVIFDCDGTLVDSFAAIYAAMAASFRDVGLPVPEESALRGMIGLPVAHQVATLAPDQAPDILQGLEDGYRRHRLGETHPHEPLFPGVRESLEALDAAGILMAVATTKSARGLDMTLDLHDLRRFFVSLQTGDRHPSKPAPGMILTALAETGATAERTVMVGDTRFDIEMAINAGVTPVGVAWGYHGVEELTAAGADTIAPDVAVLTRVLLERLSS